MAFDFCFDIFVINEFFLESLNDFFILFDYPSQHVDFVKTVFHFFLRQRSWVYPVHYFVDLTLTLLAGKSVVLEVKLQFPIAVKNVFEVLAHSTELLAEFLAMTVELLAFHNLFFTWGLTSECEVLRKSRLIEEKSTEIFGVTAKVLKVLLVLPK